MATLKIRFLAAWHPFIIIISVNLFGQHILWYVIQMRPILDDVDGPPNIIKLNYALNLLIELSFGHTHACRLSITLITERVT